MTTHFEASRVIDGTALDLAAQAHNTDTAIALLVTPLNECLAQIIGSARSQGIEPGADSPMPVVKIVVTWDA